MFSTTQTRYTQLSTRHLGQTLLVYDSVTSTNDVVLSQPLGTAVLADEQTAGRGQFGRTWQAPLGTAIQLSVTIDPPLALRRPVILTAWAALAVAETVRQRTGMAPQIKWPNDVLLSTSKVAGILIELKAVAVVGIGLNVNQAAAEFADAGLTEAGSLASICRRQFNRGEIAQELILNLDQEYDRLLTAGTSSLESRWVAMLGLVGESVIAEKRDGARVDGLLRELKFDRLSLETDKRNTIEMAPETVLRLRRRG